jgi:integrase
MHTPGHINCPDCEAEKQKALRLSNAGELKFRDAVALWRIDTRDDYSEQTDKDHALFEKRLNKFFAEIPLKDIHIGHIRTYQTARQGKADDPRDNMGKASSELINHEISLLSMVLDSAGYWKFIKPHYKRLKVPKYGKGRALADEERDRLIHCAASNPRWRVAYLGTLLSVNTGCGPGEIRKIKVKDIDFRNRNVAIEQGAKNDHRKRDYPFTDSIQWVCTQMFNRYERLRRKYGVEFSAEHYILPARIRRRDGYDFAKPQSSWKKAWHALCVKADLVGLRSLDLRHDSATNLMEKETVSEQTVEDIMGHVTQRMKKRYSHIRRGKILNALQQIEVPPVPSLLEDDPWVRPIPKVPAKVSPGTREVKKSS